MSSNKTPINNTIEISYYEEWLIAFTLRRAELFICGTSAAYKANIAYADDNVGFTVIAEALRLEYAPEGKFASEKSVDMNGLSGACGRTAKVETP